MIETLPAPAVRALEEGVLCHVATTTKLGPHVTPMVFATAGNRIWVTTSRASSKARAWRRDPRVGGLVRFGDDAVAFTGRATTYDLLDTGTWGRSLLGGPRLTAAAGRFTRKNARFFAGYAVDARRVPFAWTPPGRVFVEIALERMALVGGDRLVATEGDWPAFVGSLERFRTTRAGAGPFERLPPEVRGDLGSSGPGALAVESDQGPVVLPVSWTVEGSAVYAVLDAGVLGLSGLGVEAPASLCVDRPSTWRASEMVGAMIRGRGEVAVAGRLASGQRSAARIAGLAGARTRDVAVVRLRPSSAVWWRGWSSGTVRVA